MTLSFGGSAYATYDIAKNGSDNNCYACHNGEKADFVTAPIDPPDQTIPVHDNSPYDDPNSCFTCHPDWVLADMDGADTDTDTDTDTDIDTDADTDTDTDTNADTDADSDCANDDDPCNPSDDLPSALNIEVDIDVIPCVFPNVVRIGAKGYFPVLIRGSKELDVRTIDLGSILMGDAKPLKWYTADVSCNLRRKDFRKDLVLIFNSCDLFLDPNMTEITLTGETLSGALFTGTDTVKVIDCTQ